MKLKDALKHNGMTHETLAVLAGVDRSYITKIVTGERRPSPEIATSIEKALGGVVTRMELLYPDEVS